MDVVNFFKCDYGFSLSSDCLTITSVCQVFTEAPLLPICADIHFDPWMACLGSRAVGVWSTKEFLKEKICGKW